MVVATAALENNTITTSTTINDTGIYPRGHNPACWIYTSRHYGHGYLNVTDAIKNLAITFSMNWAIEWV